MFELHPRLKADSIDIGQIGKINCRLINDRRFPWVILVPEVKNVSEIHQLDVELQAQLARVATELGKTLLEVCDGHKLNVGALGNVVSQLHYHLVVRRHDDAAWPAPVWGFGTPTPYTQDERDMLIRKVCVAFKPLL